jgi:hypothetical protein
MFTLLRAKARTGIWIEAAGAVLAAFVAFAALSFLIDRNLRLEWPFRLALLLAFITVALLLLRRRLVQPLSVDLDDDEMALAVERVLPDMRQALISTVQFERVLAGGGRLVESPELMRAVVLDVHSRIRQIPFTRALDGRRVLRFLGLTVAAATFFGVWAGIDFSSLKLWLRRNLGMSSVEWPRLTQLHFMHEGESAVERLPQGDPLTVRVIATGRIPDQVFVNYQYRSGEKGYEPAAATGEGEFTWRVPSVIEPLVIQAEGGDGLSEKLQIEIVERPRITGLAIKVHYPEYMEKAPELVEATEGDIRVPRGARVTVAGQSHKPITDAFLMVGEQKTALQLEGEHGFHGEYAPSATSLMVIDVIDRDRLGAAQPPRLMLRVTEDRPPSLDFKLRGIGSLISFQARVPGELKVKDDFGVRSVGASYRCVQEAGAEGPKPAAAADTAFTPIDASFVTPLQANQVRYESAASVDFKPLSNSDENSPDNKVRPGMLLSLRFSAKDNYGPGEPHEAFSEMVTFRVVTRAKLTDELRRRQVEQRQELQRILEEEKLALVELREMMNPKSDNEKARQAQARLRTVSRQQKSLGTRTAFVGETYQRILWEFENNRLIEPDKVRGIEAVITEPLSHLAKDDFPPSSHDVDQFAASGDEELRQKATVSYERIVHAIEIVLKNMEDAETLAALMEELRAVIKMQDGAMHEVETRIRTEIDKSFPGGKPKDPPKDKQTDHK